MRARWLILVLVLLCTGCELRLEIDAAFERGGGGQLRVALAADEELLERARHAGAAPLDDLAATGEDIRGWRVTDDTVDGLRTVALSARFTGTDEFDRIAGELADALAAPELELLESLTARVEGHNLVVEGVAGLQPTAAVSELGLTPDEAVSVLRDEATFAYEVHVRLPAEVLDTTAERRDGEALTWTVEPGERVEVYAVGQRPERRLWPLVLGGVAGLLVAALALGRAVVTRRR